jgi:mRNA-degrading endonuclease RelE of RelBE toxin-antitoxin system
MRYEVGWTREGLEQLLAMFHRTGTAGNYVRSVAEINERLSVDPRPVDAAVHEELWRLSIGSLRVYYEINDDIREVEVVGVRAL